MASATRLHWHYVFRRVYRWYRRSRLIPDSHWEKWRWWPRSDQCSLCSLYRLYTAILHLQYKLRLYIKDRCSHHVWEAEPKGAVPIMATASNKLTFINSFMKYWVDKLHICSFVICWFIWKIRGSYIWGRGFIHYFWCSVRPAPSHSLLSKYGHFCLQKRWWQQLQNATQWITSLWLCSTFTK